MNTNLPRVTPLDVTATGALSEALRAPALGTALPWSEPQWGLPNGGRECQPHADPGLWNASVLSCPIIAPCAALTPASVGRRIQGHQARGKDTRQARRKDHFFGESGKKINKSTFVLTAHSKRQENLFPSTFISIKAHAYKELILGHVWTLKEPAKKYIYERTVSLSYMLSLGNRSKASP